ncbi:hypothetical protein [Micromonospora sp. LOL_023]|uniref:hypothetical protein n=1 Tax=Micromonospora sp. LOL_023 TaxID=3345418 RepID=UPI003A84D623
MARAAGPAGTATALLFAAMHTQRIGSGPLAETVAVVLVFNGGFGCSSATCGRHTATSGR